MRFSLLLLLLNAVVLALLLQASWARALQTRSLAAAVPNKHLAAGESHFNYVQENGQVFSWGFYYGLGANTTISSAFTVEMLGVNAASDVSAGDFHTCVVDGGAAKCCGLGGNGQLGNGASSTSYVAVQVQGLTAGVQQVVTGQYHSCAVLNTGGMRCWGADYYGQLGDGNNANTNFPVPVTNYTDSGVHSASAGYRHTCIVTTGGAALCTGFGGVGQLGNGGTVNKNVMTQVTGLTDGTVTQISCGLSHTCALLSMGGVACFGRKNYGALGADYGSNQLTPVYPVGFQEGVIIVVAGYFSTCVIDNPGRTARCFGKQDYGQFANPNATGNQNSPVVFGGGIMGITEMAIGRDTICMLDEFGGVQCAGSNLFGQLGSGSNQPEERGTLDYVVGYPVTSVPTLSPTVPTLAPTSTSTSGAILLLQPAMGYVVALLLAAMLA